MVGDTVRPHRCLLANQTREEGPNRAGISRVLEGHRPQSSWSLGRPHLHAKSCSPYHLNPRFRTRPAAFPSGFQNSLAAVVTGSSPLGLALPLLPAFASKHLLFLQPQVTELLVLLTPQPWVHITSRKPLIPVLWPRALVAQGGCCVHFGRCPVLVPE